MANIRGKSVTLEELAEIRWQGEAAFTNGKKRSKNPYKLSEPERWKAWIYGWSLVKDKCERDEEEERLARALVRGDCE